ncbi:MAG: hypothetical protein R3261_10125, partial [Alphaproteobacteria bacterium]|nr:hypothetical protein [Alphaproteobacteria bacterium]
MKKILSNKFCLTRIASDVTRASVRKSLGLLYVAGGLLLSTSLTSPAMAKTGQELVQDVNYYGLFLSGQYASTKSNFSLAATFLEEALKRDQVLGRVSDPVLIEEAQAAAFRAGRFEQSLEYAKELASRNTDIGSTTILLASEALKQQDWDLLNSYLKDLGSNQISALLKPFYRIWMAVAQGNKDRAL